MQRPAGPQQLDPVALEVLRTALVDGDSGLVVCQGPLSVNGIAYQHCLFTPPFFFVLDEISSNANVSDRFYSIFFLTVCCLRLILKVLRCERICSDQVTLIDDQIVVALAPDDPPLILASSSPDQTRIWFNMLSKANGCNRRYSSDSDLHYLIDDTACSSPISSPLNSTSESMMSTLSLSDLVGDGFRVRSRIFVFSWNMAAGHQDFNSELFQLDNHYDIYAFGVQECSNGSLFRAIHRQMKSMGCCRLHRNEKKERVYGRGDGAIFYPKFTGMAVYVRRSELHGVKIVKSVSYSTGKGSKGAVAVVLGVYGVSVVLVCAHLSSKSLNKRRRDCARIFEALSSELALGDAAHFDLIHQFDHCIFFGDLNYRITGLSVADVVLALQTDSLDALSDADELLNELRHERSFFGFMEPRRDFLPTYKLNADRPLHLDRRRSDWPLLRYTLHFKGYWYKTLNQDPVRIPSWCDRVLFSNSNCLESLLVPEADRCTNSDCYGAYLDKNLIGSDHESIYAGFELLLARKQQRPTAFSIFMFQVTIHHLSVSGQIKARDLEIVRCRAMLRRSSLLPSTSERFTYESRPFHLYCASESVLEPVQLLLQVVLADGSTGSCRFLLQNADADPGQTRVVGPRPLSSSGFALRHSVTDEILSLKALLSFSYNNIG